MLVGIRLAWEQFWSSVVLYIYQQCLPPSLVRLLPLLHPGGPDRCMLSMLPVSRSLLLSAKALAFRLPDLCVILSSLAPLTYTKLQLVFFISAYFSTFKWSVPPSTCGSSHILHRVAKTIVNRAGPNKI